MLAMDDGGIPRVGWVPEPDGRGTSSILISCLFTIFLSTWTTYHPDVKSSWSAVVWDKILITAGAILAPEIIVCVALCDWNRAKKLQYLYRKTTIEEPFIDLERKDSGILLEQSPSTAEINFERSSSECSPRNKPNFAAEDELGHPSSECTPRELEEAELDPPPFRPLSITHAQSLRMHGFCIQTADNNLIQALHVWEGKRISIKSVSLIRAAAVSITSVPLETIEDKSKSDGISRTFALIQISWLFVQLTGRAIAHLPISTLELFTASNGACAVIGYLLWWSKPKEVGVPFILISTFTAAEILERQKIFIHDPDLRYPRRYTYARHALGLIACLLGSLSVVGWAFPFPTYEERFAWRFLSFYLPISAILIWQLAMEWQERLKVWVHLYILRGVNGALFLLYIIARLYIIIEVFTGLRDSPATLYETVDWSQYLPHF